MLVHSHLFGIHYSLPATSPVVIIILLLGLLLPFLLAYYSNAFYTRSNSYITFPKVAFSNQAFIVLHGVSLIKRFVSSTSQGSSSGATNIPFIQQSEWSMSFSTNASYNNRLIHYGGDIRVPKLKAQQRDANGDNINDFLDIEIEYPLTDNEEVRSLELLLGFTYKIEGYHALSISAIAYIQTPSSSFSLSEIQFNGKLTLVQSPMGQLPLTSVHRRTMNPTSPFDTFTSDHLHQSSLSSVIANYMNQPIHAILSPLSTQIATRHPRGRGQPLRVLGKVYYVPTNVVYTPSAWEVLKFAWVQYLSLGVIVWLLCQWLIVYCIQLGIVHARVTIDRLPIPTPSSTIVSSGNIFASRTSLTNVKGGSY